LQMQLVHKSTSRMPLARSQKLGNLPTHQQPKV